MMALGFVWLPLPRDKWLEVDSLPPVMVAFDEVHRIVLGVPLCVWQIHPCTFMYVSAGQAYFTSPINTCMRREPLAAFNITSIHDIHGVLFQVYAGDDATMPWHKQTARKGDVSWFLTV